MTLTTKQQAFLALVRRHGELGVSASAAPSLARTAANLARMNMVVAVRQEGAYIWYVVAQKIQVA